MAAHTEAPCTLNTTTQDSIKLSFLQARFINLLQLYRFLRPLFISQCCRFEPSCSTYAMEAVRMHGCLRGGWLMVKRLLCCQPWHKGGFDPVP